MTTKPFLYVFNADESVLTDEARKAELRAMVAPADAVFLDAKIEAELAELDDESAVELLESIGQTERGLDALARAGFHTLKLQTYLTAGPKESRAWTIHQGDTAPKAAGVIHTDFEKGFIKAEIVSYDDLVDGGFDGRREVRGQGPHGGQGLRDGRRRRGRVPVQRLAPFQRLVLADRTPGLMGASCRYRGEMVAVRQFQVTFDCAAPERVARFWCEALGYVVPPPPQGFADWNDFDRALPAEKQGSAFACVDPTGVGPRLFFQRVPEGKSVKNRVHLDIRVGTGLVGANTTRRTRGRVRTAHRTRCVPRATIACRRRRRVLHRDAGRRRQRILSRLMDEVRWCEVSNLERRPRRGCVESWSVDGDVVEFRISV